MLAHQTPLIATVAAGLVMAYGFGLLAYRLHVQPLVGYLLAGIAVGPFTPGFAADAEMAAELAEIGIILLMFGVGLQFSLNDLFAVARIAVPGAIGRIIATTLMGAALGLAFGWDWQAGLVFGLALSVASTVVLVRALQERRLIDTERGHIAVGWVIVEDLVMVAALVLMPALAAYDAAGAAPGIGILTSLGITLAKVAAFIVLMLVVGTRVIPAVMHHTAHTGSRELFRLAVYATAIGVAYFAALLFDASFALGAFVAGIVLGESKLSQRAAEEAMPLRDAFAVLFFVSVGMLFNPLTLIEAPLAVLATLAIIMAGKSLAAYGIIRALGRSPATALNVSASLAQIGEFSFILAGIGVTSGLLPPEGRDLILAGAILSILLNPLVIVLAARADRKPVPVQEARPLAGGSEPVTVPVAPVPEEVETTPEIALSGHNVIVGFGRVGSMVGAALVKSGQKVLVFELDDQAMDLARAAGAEVIQGNAAEPEILQLAGLAAARRLFVTAPDAFESGQIIEQARAISPSLEILARAHSDAAVAHLSGLGATLTIMGENEIARRMLEQASGR